MAFILICMGSILKLTGQSPEVSQIAGSFIMAALPHILFTEMFDIHKHLMNSYRLAYLQMIAQACGTVMHVPILLAMLGLMRDNPICAIGLATSMSSLLKFIMVFGLGMLSSDIRSSFFISFQAYWRGRNESTEQANFWRIGIPSMIMFCAEGWAFQVLTLIAGLISVEDQAVQSICAVISTTLFMFGSGFQEASSSLIGNMIGANRVGFAWHYAQVLSALSIILTIVFLVPLFIWMHEIAHVFTHEPDTKKLLMQVLPVVFICFFFDVVQAQRQGVIRGLNL